MLMKLGDKKNSEDFTIFAEVKSQSGPYAIIDDSQNSSFRVLNSSLSCQPVENCDDQQPNWNSCYNSQELCEQALQELIGPTTLSCDQNPENGFDYEGSGCPEYQIPDCAEQGLVYLSVLDTSVDDDNPDVNPFGCKRITCSQGDGLEGTSAIYGSTLIDQTNGEFCCGVEYTMLGSDLIMSCPGGASMLSASDGKIPNSIKNSYYCVKSLKNHPRLEEGMKSCLKISDIYGWELNGKIYESFPFKEIDKVHAKPVPIYEIVDDKIPNGKLVGTKNSEVNFWDDAQEQTYEECIKNNNIEYNQVKYLSEEKYPHGPGTKLSQMFEKIGIKATPTCSCKAKARIMNEKGADWCEQNIDTIVEWLREESEKRKIPFVKTVAKYFVKKAISSSRKENVN